MDEIITKINDMIAEINEAENLNISFPDSYIEDLAGSTPSSPNMVWITLP